MRAGRPGLSPWRAEYESLLRWADENGRRRPFSFIERFLRVAEGAEHVVYHDPHSRRAIKATKPNRFGHSLVVEGFSATPVEYLQRLGWQNLLLGDDIRVEGIAFQEEHMEVITSQPWVYAHEECPNPEQEEIDAYLAGFGFGRISTTAEVPLYRHSRLRLLAADAHNQNVLRDVHGELAAIDVVIGNPGLKRWEELRPGGSC